MKHFNKILTLLLSVFGINYANAQCGAGQVAVTIDIVTDTWGYETYWELVPAGNACGTGTIASGGNPTETGCNNEGAQAIPFGGTGLGYASNTTITEGPFCVTDPSTLDLIIVDEYGDGGNEYTVYVDGTPVVTATEDDVQFVAATSFDDLSVSGINKEYYIFPSSQITGVDMGATVNNGGTTTITDAQLTVNVYETTGFTFATSVTSGAFTLADGTSQYQALGNHSTPTSDLYTFEYISNSATVGVDASPANDTDYYFMWVDDSVYARDNGQALHGPASIGAGAAENGKIGQLFTLSQPDVMTSCMFGLYPKNWGVAGSDPVQNITVEVYDVVNGLPATLLGTSNTFGMIGDSSATGALSIIQVNFAGGLAISSDSIAVMVTEPDTSLSLAMMVDEFTPSTQYLHWNANGWAQVDGFPAYFHHPYYLRPAFGPSTTPTCTLTGSASSNDATTTGGSEGDATATAVGGQGNLSYSWDNGGNTAMITGLVADTYCVTITDDITAGCTATACVTVSEPAAACSVMALATNVTCNGNSDGQVSVGASTGSSPYSYDWGTAGTGMLISGLAPGVYTVVMTDNASCTATDAVTISEPNALVASAMVNNHESIAGASDGSATASAAGGNGGFTYSWSNGGSVGTQMGLAAGTYTVTVSDVLGCTDVASVTIDPGVACAVTVTANSTVDNCMDNNGTATAMATGGATPYNYMWNVGGMSATVSGLMGGNTYMVTAVDALGCSASTSVSVSGTPGISGVMVTTTDVSACGGTDGTATAIVMGGTSPYTYMWFDTGMNTYGTTMMVTGLSANIYGVDVVDANGCSEGSGNAVNAVGAPSVTVSGSDATCNGGTDGSVSATVSGGASPYTYNWLDFDNAITYTTETVTGLGASTYLLTVTDNGGCSAFSVQSVQEPNAIMANANVMDLMCAGDGMGGIMTMANGGTGMLSYMWSNSETTMGISGLAAGTYGLTITDASMCTNSWSYTVSEPAALNAGASATDETTAGANDGTATASPTGGTGSYSYSWNTTDMVASLNNLAPNTYTVTVMDANGCTDSQSVTVYAAGANPCAGVSITASATTTDESAAGASDGSATVTGGGSTSGYTYNWSNGATTATAAGLTAGGYTVTVTDVNGCGSAVANATVNVAAAVTCTLSITATGTDATTNGGTDGTATVAVSGDQGALTYAWSNSGSSASINGLAAGTYTVTVTDAIVAGCVETASVTVGEPLGVIGITSSVEMNLYPNPNNGNFTVTVSKDANYTVVVRNVIGQQVEVAAFNGTAYEVNLNAESGVYFVTVIGEGFEKTEKVIVR